MSLHLVSIGSKPSWTAKLATNQGLLCSKIREEAGELCETLEGKEGQERAASEMADLLYHSMVLLHVQVCLFPQLRSCCSFWQRITLQLVLVGIACKTTSVVSRIVMQPNDFLLNALS